MPDWSKIERIISASTGANFEIKSQSGIAGGDTNQAYQIKGMVADEDAEQHYFIKFNQNQRLDMFEAEAAGLAEIEKSQTIRVPHVIASGIEGKQSYLILENLVLTMGGSAQELGQLLAKMHQYTAPKFGWYRNNTIGSTTQANTQTMSWVDFWREQRIGFQLNLLKQNGATQSLLKKGESLLNNLDSFFTGYNVQASLLHGDLWSGNYGYLMNGEPVIFDPAVYYGDREADMAMTELFGGFPADFYSAYNAVWPLDAGYETRKTLYNLYHILNHANLFGGGYVIQSENMIDQLLGYL